MAQPAEPIEVLHVDDDRAFAETTADLLEEVSDRLSVTATTSAAEGLALVADASVDCVISAYGTAEMDGLAFLRAVRTEDPALPFFLYTAEGSESVASEAIGAGVTDYVVKEAGAQQSYRLANRIVNAVERYRAEQDRDQRSVDDEVSERYHRRFLKITTDPESSPSTKTEQLLALGCERLQMDNAHLVKIDRDRDRHEVVSVHGSNIVQTGVTDLQKTYCRRTIESESAFEIQDAPAEGWQGDAAYETLGVRSYLGKRLLVVDELYGTLCFVRDEARERPFTAAEKGFLDLLCRWFDELFDRKRQRIQAETLFQYSQDAIFLVDVDHRETFTIEEVNDAYGRLVGRPKETLRGSELMDVLDAQNGQRIVDRYVECVDRAAPIEYEETVTIDGEPRHWQTQLAPVIEDGEVIQLVGATRDVTDHRDRERALSEERAFVEQALDTLEEVFYVVEPDGSLRRWNSVVTEVTGYSETEVASMQATEFFAAEDRPDIGTALSEALTDGTSTVEATIETADGETIPYELTGSRLDDTEGTLVGLVGVGRDISDRIERERELREQRAERKRQNERLENFATVVSHDLRNPLNVASGRLELVAEESDSDHLAAIERAHDRMATLIEDLLTLARAEKVVTETESVTLETVCPACWDTVATREASLTVTTTDSIVADRNRLKQILENLFRNAIEHGGTDVHIEIGLRSDRDGFYVADDGLGIPTEDQASVFESGFSTASDGTGFGLAIVREIATSHGWSVDVTEAAGGGARFDITGVEIVDSK